VRAGKRWEPFVSRVLIAVDHAICREGLRKILEAAGHVMAGAVATGEEAVERVVETHPDVIILDLSMPGRGGLAAVQELKRRVPRSRVLVMTMRREDSFALRCLGEGADGYLSQDAGAEQLLAAVRKVERGGKYVTAAPAERLAASRRARSGRPPHDKLSRRELQVLSLIGAGKNATAIAAELDLSVKTVSTYRGRILEKIGLRSTAELIRYAVLQGLSE
jgi:two-component system, NarL family, invasion response regulator UvrY